MRLLIVALGGAVGSALRYLIGLGLQSRSFPFATLVVNVIGCFAIGALAQWYELREAPGTHARLFLTVGLLGGFTTFSAFANETALFVRNDRPGLAVVNVAAHLLIALGAVWLGRICVVR